MSTNLSRFFRNRRAELGLKPGDVARRMGYTSVVGGANKVVVFEQKGYIRSQIFPKLVAALGIDQETVTRLIEQDQREYIQAWWEWSAQPIDWVVHRRDVPFFVPPWAVPEDITTEADAEAWAVQFAVEHHAPVVLYLSRRVSVWINKEGRVESHHEASPGEEPLPYMQLKGGRRKFHIVAGPQGLEFQSVDLPPEKPADSK